MRLVPQNTKVEALKRVPLFEGLSKKELTQLAKVAEDLDVQPGKVLCREGATGHEFFVIVEGEVEVTRGGRNLGTRGPGDFFGEIALVQRMPRTATVTAKTPLRFFVLTGASFRQLLDSNAIVERKVLRALANRVSTLATDAL